MVANYFTKWIECEALTNITEKQMESFLQKSIMCRFGVPHLIITDNGIQFEGKFKNLCADLQITLAQSFVKTPQTNEQIKAMKKKILTTLKQKVSEAKSDWLEELPRICTPY